MASFKMILPYDEQEVLEVRELLKEAGVIWASRNDPMKWWPVRPGGRIYVDNDRLTYGVGTLEDFERQPYIQLTLDDLRAFYGPKPPTVQFDQQAFEEMLAQ